MSQEASSFSALSNTKYLSIDRNQDLPYLETLEISNCSKLKDFSPSIQYLTFLKRFQIENCEELDMSNDDLVTWRSLRSLQILEFFSLPKLLALPQGIQHATGLESLVISDCKRFTSIPEWINNLKSLQILSILACPTLK
ncbi:LRR domain containing protein [Trema orientale]|uniref:LRR domain containing protein n=1 Tax=Trema orientale TaxID=63057 RepID=A0A2P5CTU5_TREOI|nr:LRR domain containing protein [Trema orientale]